MAKGREPGRCALRGSRSWESCLWGAVLCAEGPAGEPQLGRDVVPVIKARCIKCHGPAKREGKLDLSTPGGIARGGENGVAIVPGDAAASLLWQRIADDEMPPDEPLAADERTVLQRRILARAQDFRRPTILRPATIGRFAR